MPSSISSRMPRKRTSLCILGLTFLLACFFATKGFALEKPYPRIKESSLLSVYKGSLFLPLNHSLSLLGNAIPNMSVSLPENGREAALLRRMPPHASQVQRPVWMDVVTGILAAALLLLAAYTYFMRRRLQSDYELLAESRNRLLGQIGNFQSMAEAAGIEYWEYAENSSQGHEPAHIPSWDCTLHLGPDTLNVWTELIHPADRDHAFSAFMEYIHSGSREVHEAEYRMRTQDGAWRWMLVKAVTVTWNPEGKSLRVLGLKLDIQQMKNAQKTFLASQDMARALLEQTSRFIGLVSPKGSVVAMNRASLRRAGVSDRDIVGRYFWDAPWWDDPHQAKSMLEDVFHRVRSGENVDCEMTYLNQRGEPFPLELKASPFRDDGGGLQYIVIEGRDLSEIRANQTELLDSERKFRGVFENSPCAIAISRFADGGYIEANNSFLEMMNISRQELPRFVTSEIDSFPPEHALRIRALLQENRPVHSMETVMHRPDGSTCHVLYSGSLITLGGQLCVLSIIWDITRLKTIQDMMVQSEKMLSLGGIAAGIAHEINNPLGVVLQASQTLALRLKSSFPKNQDTATKIGLDMELLDRYLEARKIHDFVRDIESAAARAADIVRHMLDFSRRSESRTSFCSIPAIIDRALNLAASDYDLKKKYDFKRIQIIRDYNEFLPEITCTETEIEQVLLNLLRNAAQAMMDANPPIAEPRIRITARLQAQELRIEIADNGPGIAQENRKRIFEPFFTTKAAGSGTGLGLSVSYFIITKGHGGRMHVLSPPEGGTTFIIELPWKDPVPEEMPSVQADRHLYGLEDIAIHDQYGKNQ